MAQKIHPLIVKTSITTVTFESEDSISPTNFYGDEVPVEIVNHDINSGNPDSITVKIGNKMFTPNDLEFLLRLVEKYKSYIKEWQK